MNNAKMPDVSCYVISTSVGSDKRKIKNGRIFPFLVFQVLGKKRFWCCFKISWMLSNFKHWPPRLDVVIRYLSFKLLNTIDSTLYVLFFVEQKKTHFVLCTNLYIRSIFSTDIHLIWCLLSILSAMPCVMQHDGLPI